MNISFQGKYVPFTARFLKGIIPTTLMSACGFITIYYSSYRTIHNQRTFFLIFMLICYFIGIVYVFFKTRKIITQLKFVDDKLHVCVRSIHSEFEDVFNFRNVLLKIHERKISKGKVIYELEISSNQKQYYLNENNGWSYTTLSELINEYKSRAGKTVML